MKTVVEARSSRRPEARYVVGRDAGQFVMLHRPLQRLRDRLLMNSVGLRPDAFVAG